MAIQEGVGFQRQFNTILSVGHTILPALVLGTQLVLRDENLHTVNWGTLEQCLVVKPPQSIVFGMIHEYVNIEDEYIEYVDQKWQEEKKVLNDKSSETSHHSSSGRLNTQEHIQDAEINVAFLTVENQMKSVRFQANFVAHCLGYKIKPYPEITEQPIPILERQGMKKQVQIFESHNPDYQVNAYQKWQKEIQEFAPNRKAVTDLVNNHLARMEKKESKDTNSNTI
jgi:hypothetical protein